MTDAATVPDKPARKPLTGNRGRPRIPERKKPEPMPPGAFAAWIERQGLTVTTAAAVLGLSRRAAGMYAANKSKPPHYVAMACAAISKDLPLIEQSAFNAWRERMKLSVTEAAHQLGCSRNAVINYANGSRVMPRYFGLACAVLAEEYDAIG